MDKNEAGVQDVIAKIEKFSDTYRAAGKQLHELITTTAPQLQPRLWYGMPGYALKSDGPVVLFFREDKYVSFGLTENTNLAELGSPEEGLVEAAWYLSKLDAAAEAKIADIVRKVVPIAKSNHGRAPHLWLVARDFAHHGNERKTIFAFLLIIYPLINELVWILTGCCGFILVCHRRYTSY